MFRVEMPASRSTAPSDVSLLVDVEAVLARRKSMYGARHVDLAVRELGEGDVAGDTLPVEASDRTQFRLK